MEALNQLSYRELQAKAKASGIAANQKKDILIQELLKSSDETPILDITNADSADSSENIIEDSSTESTQVTANKTEECVHNILASNDNESDNSVVVIVADQDINSQQVELFENEEIVMDQIADEEAEYFECLEYEENEEETEELTEMLSDMKLRGIATPAGKKTVFDESTETVEEIVEQKINWGIDYSSANAEEEEEDENCDPQNRPVRVGATPSGKHTVFASPELKMGNAVHWTYDDYNMSAAQTNTSTTTPAKATVEIRTNTCQKLRFENDSNSTESILLNTQTPGKMLNKDDKMSFWLSKGPKTPIR